MASPSRVGNLTGRTLGGDGDGSSGGDATARALLLCIIKSYDNVGECEVQKSPLNLPPPPPVLFSPRSAFREGKSSEHARTSKNALSTSPTS
ncbi:hypothetical protein V1478_005924 [Vespula squamosa]|uniref:Uncharacterized protein n=1 Tax=Vespula squamosa TaxID=30214 RepID=A0ABD2BA74_VESSQ